MSQSSNQLNQQNTGKKSWNSASGGSTTSSLTDLLKQSLNLSGSAPASTSSQTAQTSELVSGAKRTVQNTTGTERETGTIVTDNMDPAGRAALTALLAQLQQGGSAQQKQAVAALQAQLQNATANQEQYTVQAAREQAQRSNALYSQQFLEQVMPQINAAMEASGSSGDSMNALLSQDAATRTAAQAAAAEAGLITQYGQLLKGQQDVVSTTAEQMGNDPVQNALIQALGISKGSMSTETRNLLKQISGQSITDETSTSNTSKSATGSSTETDPIKWMAGLIGLQNANTASTTAANDNTAAIMNAQANQANAASNRITARTNQAQGAAESNYKSGYLELQKLLGVGETYTGAQQNASKGATGNLELLLGMLR
jgi:predicted HicB family RNase H-like nuclease